MTSLGSGSYGVVNRQQIAVKSYHNSYSIINRDLLNEVSILKHLNDKLVTGVPTLYDANVKYDFDESNMTYSMRCELRMSYEGKSMKSMIRKMNFKQACNYITEYISSILAVLLDIHEAGVVHNDIKTDNILVDDNRVTIVDYGLSDFHGHINVDAAYHIYYIPERSDEEVPASTTNDIWQLGVFLANELLGKLNMNLIPVKRDEVNESIQDMMNINSSRSLLEILDGSSVRNVGIVLPSDIPKHLRSILASMLKFNPSHRSYSIIPIIDGDLPSYLYNKKRVRSYVRHLESYLHNINRHPTAISVDYIIIGIDILRRCMNMNIDEYRHDIIGAAIYLITCSYVSVEDSNELISSIMSMGIDYDELYHAQLRILKHINWKVMTVHNSTALDVVVDVQIIERIASNMELTLNLNNKELIEWLVN
jgi:serine/threonine protein kinase